MSNNSFEKYPIENIPLFQEFRSANPDSLYIGPLEAIMTFGLAIHWKAIFDIIWPDFTKKRS